MFKSEPLAQLISRRSYVHCTNMLSTVRGGAVFIFLVSLLLRIGYAIVAPHVDPFLVRDPLLGDAASYDRIARTLLAGGEYGEAIGRPSAFWPPMYPFLLTAIYAVVGYDHMAARLTQAVLGAVLPPMVFLIGHHIGERQVAWLASLGAATYPYLIYFGAWLIAESLYFALAGLILWVGMHLQQRPAYWKALVLGGLIGVAALTKPTIFMQLPFMSIWFLLCISSSPLWRRFLFGVSTVLMIIVILAPWSARNYNLFGKLIPVSTNGGYTFYGANNANAFGGHYEHFPPKIEGLNEVEEQSEYYRLGIEWIKEHPGQFAWLISQKFKRLVSPLSVASSEQDHEVPGSWAIYCLYSIFLLVSLYGVVLSLSRWREFFLLYTPILGVITSTIVFYGDVRYTLPAVPALLIFAAMGLQSIALRFVQRA